jgi:hypothetical protein
LPHATARSLVLALFVFGSIAGCQAKGAAPSSGAPAPPVAGAPASKAGQATLAAARRSEAAALRQIVYKAELSVEVRSPADVEAAVTALVEREGGYVASAARAVSETSEGDVSLTLRVPAERFTAVLIEIRRLGEGKRSEHIASEDVTDEVVDLDARLRAETRLEEQLLELLKTATTVESALNVHKELGNVRTEIERIQGRRRVLEREVRMSTIELVLRAPKAEAVSFSKIGRSFSDAYSDSVVVAGGIVVLAIRTAGVLVPIVLLLGLPVLLAIFGLRRRAQKKLGALATPSD